MKNKIQEPNYPIYGYLLDMDHTKFVDWACGEIAIAIFNGKLKERIYAIIEAARARGMRDYYESLNNVGTKTT